MDALSSASSRPSSKVVAVVEYDPWAEELLLCGGDGMLNCPSEPRAPGALGIDFPSPLLFKRLGVLPPRKLLDVVPLESLDGFFVLVLFNEFGALASSGERAVVELELDEAVDVRPVDFGGWGNDATLMVLRNVFSGLPGTRPTEVERWAWAFRFEVEELVCRECPTPEGLGDAEGARSFEGGLGEAARGVSAGTGRFFFVFEVGSGGKAEVGGLVAGRDGVGIVDVMVIRFLVPSRDMNQGFGLLKSCKIEYPMRCPWKKGFWQSVPDISYSGENGISRPSIALRRLWPTRTPRRVWSPLQKRVYPAP